MGAKQNKIGDEYEKKLSQVLNDFGYWVHRVVKGVAGQPCDFIALSEQNKLLLDCKHSFSHIFNFDRIEPNQYTAFGYASKKGIECGFAIFYDEKWYYLPYEIVLLKMSLEYNSVDIRTLEGLNIWKLK